MKEESGEEGGEGSGGDDSEGDRTIGERVEYGGAHGGDAGYGSSGVSDNEDIGGVESRLRRRRRRRRPQSSSGGSGAAMRRNAQLLEALWLIFQKFDVGESGVLDARQTTQLVALIGDGTIGKRDGAVLDALLVASGTKKKQKNKPKRVKSAPKGRKDEGQGRNNRAMSAGRKGDGTADVEVLVPESDATMYERIPRGAASLQFANFVRYFEELARTNPLMSRHLLATHGFSLSLSRTRKRDRYPNGVGPKEYQATAEAEALAAAKKGMPQFSEGLATQSKGVKLKSVATAMMAAQMLVIDPFDRKGYNEDAKAKRQGKLPKVPKTLAEVVVEKRKDATSDQLSTGPRVPKDSGTCSGDFTKDFAYLCCWIDIPEAIAPPPEEANSAVQRRRSSGVGFEL